MKFTDLILEKLWPRWFATLKFARFNTYLLQLGLSGLGVLNWRDSGQSGERWLVSDFLKKRFAKRKNLIVVDVGAHVGQSSEEFRAAFQKARILAFEPSPAAFAQAKERLRASDVELHQLAVSDEPGSVELFDYAGEAENAGSQHASLFKDVFKGSATGASCVQVGATTIDLICEQSGLEKIDFLKIDTEGCELRVLQGARDLLARRAVEVIQFEFNEMNVFSRVFMTDFFAILDGYSLFRLLPRGLMPLNPDWIVASNLFAYQNIVAIRRGKKNTNPA